jgi:hypothetical protein
VPDSVPILRIVSPIGPPPKLQGSSPRIPLLPALPCTVTAARLNNPQACGCQPSPPLHPRAVPTPAPRCRQVDPRMAERMATWVVWGVINWQRKFEEYLEAQRAARWDLGIEGRRNLDNCDVRVGVLGFGGCGRGAGRAGAWGLGAGVSEVAPKTWTCVACPPACPAMADGRWGRGDVRSQDERARTLHTRAQPSVSSPDQQHPRAPRRAPLCRPDGARYGRGAERPGLPRFRLEQVPETARGG